MMITKTAQKDANFTNILRFVDWLWYSTPGQTLTKWGVQGQTYTTDSSGNFNLAPNLTFSALSLNMSAKAGTPDLRNQYGYGSGNFILMYGGPQNLAYSYMTPDQKSFVQLVNSNRKILASPPPILYSSAQQASQNLLDTTIMDDVNTWTLNFLTGKNNVSKDWNTYVSTINAAGASQYLQTATKVYKSQQSVALNIPK
jgi:putative aldouronate transport system substrate-binding protein